jgi:hypothetical protein
MPRHPPAALKNLTITFCCLLQAPTQIKKLGYRSRRKIIPVRRRLFPRIIIFARALPIGNGLSLQITILGSLLEQFMNFQHSRHLDLDKIIFIALLPVIQTFKILTAEKEKNI